MGRLLRRLPRLSSLPRLGPLILLPSLNGYAEPRTDHQFGSSLQQFRNRSGQGHLSKQQRFSGCRSHHAHYRQSESQFRHFFRRLWTKHQRFLWLNAQQRRQLHWFKPFVGQLDWCQPLVRRIGWRRTLQWWRLPIGRPSIKSPLQTKIEQLLI